MNTPACEIIEIKEHESCCRDSFPRDLADELWKRFRSQIVVDSPGPQTNWRWRLTAQDWVGYIPLSKQLAISLQPKVPLGNLFRMLEYAYRLKDLAFLKGIANAGSLREYYENLAHLLARRILDRTRKGLYRSYIPENACLSYLRGRLDFSALARRPWSVNLPCHYQNHTADVEDNQILAWTLWRISQSGFATEKVLPSIRQAFRSLIGCVSLAPFSPQACLNRLYHRLNEDYQPLHALCRFFLEQSGPTHHIGEKAMMPFLVNMPHLYELFIAEWLRQNLPANLRLMIQEKIDIDETEAIYFKVDLVIYDARGNKPLCVLDTKYKACDASAPDDIAQVVAYAEAKGCKEAILIYPSIATFLDKPVGNIRVRNIIFGLDGDLEVAGKSFLDRLYYR